MCVPPSLCPPGDRKWYNSSAPTVQLQETNAKGRSGESLLYWRAHGAAGKYTRLDTSAANNRNAVDQHEWNPGRRQRRFTIRRPVNDARRIEQHKIGIGADA